MKGVDLLKLYDACAKCGAILSWASDTEPSLCEFCELEDLDLQPMIELDSERESDPANGSSD